MTLCYIAAIHEKTRQALRRRAPDAQDVFQILWPDRLAKVADEFDPFASYLFFTAPDPTFAAQRLGVELLTDTPDSDTRGPVKRVAIPSQIDLDELIAVCQRAEVGEQEWREGLVGRAVTVPMRKARAGSKHSSQPSPTDDIDQRDLDRLTRVSGVVIEVHAKTADVMVTFFGRSTTWHKVPLAQIDLAAA